MKFNFNPFGLKQRFFRNWSNKGFGVYNSLGAVVKVCVLSATYSILAMPVATFAQPDTVTVSKNVDIDEVIVNSKRATSTYSEFTRVVTVISRDELGRVPAASLQQVLEQVASIDIRQRGGHGVQADISLRGGSFDQTLVLLNGVNISDPQTGHHNLNIPVDLDVIERIEILQGPGSRIYGAGAFSGAINIITSNGSESNARILANAGEHGLLGLTASASVGAQKAGLFLTASKKASEGYTPNTDFSASNIYLNSHLNLGSGQLGLQLGYQDKGFGANSFYTPKYPNQFEQVKALFSEVSYGGTKSSFSYNTSVYFRRHFDRFELFRSDAPSWYATHNYHRSSVFGSRVDGAYLSPLGKTRLGVEARNEEILSNVLGTPLSKPVKVSGTDNVFYSKSDSRWISSFFVDHTIYINGLTISGGALASTVNGNNIDWSYGVDVSQRIFTDYRVFASANHTFRYPTFTDLYYQGPTNLGNPNLKPESATTYELGIKHTLGGFSSHLSGFLRDAKDVIDWVKLPSDEKWQSANHTQLTTYGVEAAYSYVPQSTGQFIRRIGMSFLLQHSDKDSEALDSYYALDFLRAKVNLSLDHKIYRGLSANWNLMVQDRAGSYTHFVSGTQKSYDAFALLDAGLNWQGDKLSIGLNVHNVLDKSYVDLANIEQPGRWVSFSCAYNIRFR
ncbi:MAG: TonB-dependent receptor [Bacteroidales bacterium]|nr:TonB-dependent receptor [Bacteroidales bacterium]MBN2749742.1 TonB-dependent receptor [Bacteroidales bacterium]